MSKPRDLTDIPDAAFDAMAGALTRGDAATMGEAYEQLERATGDDQTQAILGAAMARAFAEGRALGYADGVHGRSEIVEALRAVLDEAEAGPASRPAFNLPEEIARHLKPGPPEAPANPAFDALAAAVARAQARVGAALSEVQEAARQVAIAASDHGSVEEAPPGMEGRLAMLPEEMRMAAWWAASDPEPDDDGYPKCARCDARYRLRDGTTATALCDSCAQDVSGILGRYLLANHAAKAAPPLGYEAFALFIARSDGTTTKACKALGDRLYFSEEEARAAAMASAFDMGVAVEVRRVGVTVEDVVVAAPPAGETPAPESPTPGNGDSR